MKLNFPVDIFFCKKLEDQLPAAVSGLGCTSLCIVTGLNSARKSGLLDRVEKILQNKGMSYFNCAVSAEPGSEAVDSIAQEITANQADGIIALGGGSVIDAAKSAAIQTVNGKKFEEIEFNTTDLSNALPIIAVPTVSGSGSEATPYSVINNSHTGRKSTIAHQSLFPASTLICPELTTEVSPMQTASGAFDALIHCLEAYTSTSSNELTDAFATRGAGLVFRHLRASLQNPEDLLRRKALAEASLCGGISIAHVRTGAIHTLSVALQKYSPLPHGMLNAALTRYAGQLNKNHYAGRAMEFMNSVGFQAENDRQAVELLCDWMYETYPLPAECFSVPEADFQAVIDRFKQDKGLLEVNPAPLTDESINEFITGVLHAQGQ